MYPGHDLHPPTNEDNNMTTRTSFLALAFLLVPALTAFAGMDYPMKCKNCGFTCRV